MTSVCPIGILHPPGVLVQEWSWVAVKPCSGFWDFDGTMHKRSFYILRLVGLELLVAIFMINVGNALLKCRNAD